MNRDRANSGQRQAIERRRRAQICRSVARQTIAFFVLALPLLLAPSAEGQTCPQDICTCLGAAGDYSVIGTDLKLRHSKASVADENDLGAVGAGTSVLGSICAMRGTMSGGEELTTWIDGSAVFVPDPGRTAVRFKGWKLNNVPQESVDIHGVLTTNGGRIIGQEFALIDDGITTSPGSPAALHCSTAMADAQTASALLRDQTPVQEELGDLVVEPGEIFTINAGSGVHVVNATSITLKGRKEPGGGYLSGILEIHTAVDTDAVIINIEKTLSVGKLGLINIFTGSPDVIINVHGEKAAVKIDKAASIDAFILAPRANIRAGLEAYFASGLIGAKVRLKGVTVDLAPCL